MRRGCQSRGRVAQPLKKPSNQDEVVVAIRLRGARQNCGLDSLSVSTLLDWFLGLYRFVLQRNRYIKVT